MGPILIFDKSLLQSLNSDEAMWLDNFFLSNITPLFFIETLADLEKQIKSGRTPEDIVGNLAYKTPDMGSKANAHHKSLLDGELFGGIKLDMKLGRPHISGGQTLELDNKTGIIFQPSPEEEALVRWQHHEFLDLERLLAKAWRRSLSNINLKEYRESFQRFFPIGRPKTLEDVKRIVDFHINGSDQERILMFGLSLIGLSAQGQREVTARWRVLGKPLIREFAPYFTHVFSVDFFFYLAIAADIIGHDRPSHKIDLAYLYYLPFCMVFTSNDNLHSDIIPFFLRDNQTFVSGTELKKDLEKIDYYYDAYPEDVKKRGVMSFAFYPPDDKSFLVTRLWDKHMSPKWREQKAQHRPDPASELGKKIIEEMRRFKEEGMPIPDDSRVGTDKANHILIERKVWARKGKSTRFPPEVLSAKE